MSQCVVRLLLCRIRNARGSAVNQTFVKVPIGTDGPRGCDGGTLYRGPGSHFWGLVFRSPRGQMDS